MSYTPSPSSQGPLSIRDLSPSLDEWGAQRSPAWSQQSSIPSPRQWAVFQQSQEDLPSPIQYESPPSVGFELVYHNAAELARAQQAQQEQQAQQYGMAWHVHNVFDNIKDNYEKIMEVFGGHIKLDILQTVGPLELIKALDLYFADVIARKYGTPFQQGEEYNKVGQVLNRLYLASREFLTPSQRNEIFTWIQFVMRQPDSFQFIYVDLFINDTFMAYDTGDDKLSCPKGITERLLLSIADACILYCFQYKKKNKKKTKQTEKNKTKKRRLKTTRTARNMEIEVPEITGGEKPGSEFATCDNATYRKLIILFKKEVPDMNDLTKEWSVILTGELAQTMTTAQIKQSFIDFMERKYKLYGLNKSAAIKKRADEFDEFFENKNFE